MFSQQPNSVTIDLNPSLICLLANTSEIQAGLLNGKSALDRCQIYRFALSFFHGTPRFTRTNHFFSGQNGQKKTIRRTVETISNSFPASHNSVQSSGEPTSGYKAIKDKTKTKSSSVMMAASRTRLCSDAVYVKAIPLTHEVAIPIVGWSIKTLRVWPIRRKN